MALIGTCFCCSLLTAAILAGMISTFLYSVAFALEIWSIIEVKGKSYYFDIMAIYVNKTVENMKDHEVKILLTDNAMYREAQLSSGNLVEKI